MSKIGLECKICGDRGEGIHFGVLSCRACAAFFRRSISNQKSFFCKTNRHNCQINPSIKAMCKSCRLQKCKLIGMKSEEVQPKRDSLATSTSMDYLCGNSQLLLKKRAPEISLTCPSLLEKLKQNYRHLCKVRKTIEDNLPNPHKQKSITSGKMKGFRLASIREINSAFQCCIPSVEDFIVSSFPEYSTLSSAERNLVLSSFKLIIWGLGNSYRTYKLVAPELYETISLMTETYYLDKREFNVFLAGSAPAGKEDVAKIVESRLSNSKQKMKRAMYLMNIQEEEYVALLGLMLWSPRFEATTQNIENLSKKMRNAIFQQIHQYYTNNSVLNVEYAIRLGELTSLQSVAIQELWSFREDVELFVLLEAIEKEQYFYNAIRNSIF